MPYDPTSFVLGSGGANWGLPQTGWWNTPSMRFAGGTPVIAPTAGGGGGGGARTMAGSSYRVPSFNYAAGVAQPSAQLTDLTNYINNLQRTAQTLANQARIPGAAGLEAQSSQNIAAGLRGEVAPDVIRLLQRQAAERGVDVGPESANANAAYLQALGLTSTGRQEEAQRELTAAYARNPAAPLFDPSRQLLSPQEAAQLDLEQQRLTQQAQLEQERLALEQERLRSSVGAGGGGVGRMPTYARPGMETTAEVNPATRTYTGATGDVLSGSIADPFGTSQWWESIGYGQPAAPRSEARDNPAPNLPYHNRFRLAWFYPPGNRSDPVSPRLV